MVSCSIEKGEVLWRRSTDQQRLCICLIGTLIKTCCRNLLCYLHCFLWAFYWWQQKQRHFWGLDPHMNLQQFAAMIQPLRPLILDRYLTLCMSPPNREFEHLLHASHGVTKAYFSGHFFCSLACKYWASISRKHFGNYCSRPTPIQAWENISFYERCSPRQKQQEREGENNDKLWLTHLTWFSSQSSHARSRPY